MPRACVIVLDAVGAGELPDAVEFGDEGSNTLANVARAVGGLDLPTLEALGFGNIEPLEGCAPQPAAQAVAGRLLERSKGKDTTTGHWELMGVVTPQAMPTYPYGFPDEVIDPFMNRTGRGVLGNKPSSGIVSSWAATWKTESAEVYTIHFPVFWCSSPSSWMISVPLAGLLPSTPRPVRFMKLSITSSGNPYG